MQRHLVGSDVPQQFFRAGTRLRLGFADIDQRRISQPVDRHVLTAAGLAPTAAIPFINTLCGVESGKKRRLDVTVRAHLRGAAGARRTDPNRRMRLLNGTWPDVDRAIMEEAALVAERTVVVGPTFDDEIERLPMT